MGLWVRPATPTGRAGAYFVAPFADGLALLGLFGGIRATHHECLWDASGLRGGAAALRPLFLEEDTGGHINTLLAGVAMPILFLSLSLRLQ